MCESTQDSFPIGNIRLFLMGGEKSFQASIHLEKGEKLYSLVPFSVHVIFNVVVAILGEQERRANKH